MPKVTIWIRKEDEEKWGAIENKPEWLHKVLNPVGIVDFEKSMRSLIKTNPELLSILQTIVTEKDPTQVAIDYEVDGDGFAKNARLVNLCKHGADPKLCKHARPGKICK